MVRKLERVVVDGFAVSVHNRKKEEVLTALVTITPKSFDVWGVDRHSTQPFRATLQHVQRNGKKPTRGHYVRLLQDALGVAADRSCGQLTVECHDNRILLALRSRFGDRSGEIDLHWLVAAGEQAAE